METYEQKYNIALDWARKTYPHTCGKEKEDLVERVFPDLKKSEDERTRNEIIAFIEQAIHRCGGTPIPKEKEDRWISYLENKKKHRPTNSEKPKEWSEEDKHRLEQAINALGRNEYYVLVDWFKHLPERINLQSKTEWSEEDEETLACAISVFEDFAECKNVSVPPASAKRYLKRLKSLRPQPHWKPSEEQMVALNKVVNGEVLLTTQHKSLESLCNDLKSL